MAKAIKERSEIKKYAALARQRMKMGYWNKIVKEREEFLMREGDTPENRLKISQMQKSRFARENSGSASVSDINEKEKRYLLVCNMLDADEDTANPIGQLIDYDKYNALDERSKQRYILELVREYDELKERYYQERMIKSC